MADDFKANSFVDSMSGRAVTGAGDDLLPPIAPPQLGGQNRNPQNNGNNRNQQNRLQNQVNQPNQGQNQPRREQNANNGSKMEQRTREFVPSVPKKSDFNYQPQANRENVNNFGQKQSGKKDVFKTTEEQKVEEEKLRRMISNQYLEARELLRQIGARFDGRLTGDQIATLVGEVQKREYETL